MNRVKCPAARMAKCGNCLAVGCNHFSGSYRKVCVCCTRRAPNDLRSRYELLIRMGTTDQLLNTEAELLGWLAAHPRKCTRTAKGWAFRDMRDVKTPHPDYRWAAR